MKKALLIILLVIILGAAIPVVLLFLAGMKAVDSLGEFQKNQNTEESRELPPAKEETPTEENRELSPAKEEKPVEANKKMDQDTHPDWEVYKNDEMGIEFKYPKDLEIRERREMADLDIGKKLEISAIKADKHRSVFSIEFTSKDFGEGISEGCCYYFSGETLDLGLSNEEVEKNINAQFEKKAPIKNLKRLSIGGKNGVSFFKLSSYIGNVIHQAFIIPISNEIYSNAFISSPSLDGFGDETERFTDAESRVKFNQLVDEKADQYRSENKDFYEILDTLKFY
jgi:hypothetical protein